MSAKRGQLRVLAACAVVAALLLTGFVALRARSDARPLPVKIDSPATAPAMVATTSPSPDASDVKTFIWFGMAADRRLHLDMASPPTGTGPFPAVVCIHGGGWQIGHRCTHLRTIKLLSAQGYVAVTVDYRLSPDHKFPAPLEDVKCAVRFLRANAAKYNIDPNRIAALGDSAGGHLALLLALTDPADGMEGTGGSEGFSSKVNAVVNYFGPSDLTNWKTSAIADLFLQKRYGKKGAALLADFLGTDDPASPLLAKASPVSYIRAGDPPVLTFHGMLDPLVPPSQSIALHEKLQKACISQKLITLPTCTHGWAGKERERTDQQMIEFLDEHLKVGSKQ